MDNNMMNTPYIFDACQTCHHNVSGCTFAYPAAELHYARAYVAPTPYDNIAPPDLALMQGTVFNDIYMPYMPGRKRRMMMEV